MSTQESKIPKGSPSLAIALYKPTEGNADKLKEILGEHIPTLRQYGLITDRTAYTAQSEDGTVIEVFEWKNNEAIEAAHAHPAIRTIWGRMEGICQFPGLKDLPEAHAPFPDFEILNAR